MYMGSYKYGLLIYHSLKSPANWYVHDGNTQPIHIIYKGT
jgi:hypothetical protein